MTTNDFVASDSLPVNILIVDDNEDNLTVLEAVLDSKDYSLIRANSGPEAIALAACHDLACILLDVQMPGKDGFQTAKELRKHSRSKEVPIIFVTAIYSEEAFVHQGYASGAVDYIFKPFNPTILQSKVSVFVDLYKKTLALVKQSELLRQKELAELKIKNLEREWVSREKYRTLVESIDHCIIWSADPEYLNGNFVSPLVVKLTGYTDRQWLATPNFFVEHVFPEDKAVLLEAIGKMRTGEDASVEHRMFKRNGEVLWLHTSLRLVRNLAGDPYELCGLSVDITASKSAVAMRDQFLSIASHELLTPLTSLKLQLQSMKRTAQDGSLMQLPREKCVKMFERSDKQIDRVSGLIDNLLNVSRINLNHMELEPQLTDLGKVIRNVTEQFSDHIIASGNSIVFNVESEIFGIWDPFRMEQVVVNLLTNALKYGNRLPIKISLSSRDNWAFLEIQDQGIGIANDDHKRIFELFERAVSAQHYGGLGLGLFIVKNIVEKHGGRISVKSELGKGASFRIELPLNLIKAEISKVQNDTPTKMRGFYETRT